MRLNYAIKFVSDMDRAIAFYRDNLGFEPKFQSPFWSEFNTGETTLALHPASDENPAGSVQLGLGSEDLAGFYGRRDDLGITFTQPPTACTEPKSRASATSTERRSQSAAPDQKRFEMPA